MFAEHTDNVTTSDQPTGLVKWFPRSMMQAHDRELYLQWSVQTYKNSKLVGRRLEWRRVEVGSLDELT